MSSPSLPFPVVTGGGRLVLPQRDGRVGWGPTVCGDRASVSTAALVRGGWALSWERPF